MNRLKVLAMAAMLMWAAADGALAEPRDAVQAIRLKLPSPAEVVAALLNDHDLMTIEKGALIPRGCATRDLALITMIEDAGDDASVNGEALGKAFLVVLEARGVCLAGRPVNALALYDSAIALLSQSGSHAGVSAPP
jgi:hypothetical protein